MKKRIFPAAMDHIEPPRVKLYNCDLQSSFVDLKQTLNRLQEMIKRLASGKEKTNFTKMFEEIQKNLIRLLLVMIKYEDNEKKAHEELEMLRYDVVALIAKPQEKKATQEPVGSNIIDF